MTETTTAKETVTPQATESHSFQDIVKALVGKPVTIVYADSYEAAPIGYQIKAGFYRGKAVGMGRDYLVVVTEFSGKKRDDDAEPVKQYVPLTNIKRLSVMKGERILHL